MRRYQPLFRRPAPKRVGRAIGVAKYPGEFTAATYLAGMMATAPPAPERRLSTEKLTAEHLLESVVRITQERNQDSLEASLVQTMIELLPVNEIALLRALGGGSTGVEEIIRVRRGCEQGGIERTGSHRLVTPEPGIIGCMAKREMMILEQPSGGVTLLYPVLVGERVSRVFLFSCISCPSAEQRLIDGFLRIYRNYLLVLDESERDTLTGLLNRRTFDAHITRILASQEAHRTRGSGGDEEERRRVERSGRHWLGIFDIDHFKRINDAHGHLYGDEVLLLMAQIMRSTFRTSDLLFRYGGEEFVAVLTPTGEEMAMRVFERFREQVEAFDFPKVGRVTISIGVVPITTQDIPSEVVGHADQALYHAKTHGRNRVCSYDRLVEAGELTAAAVTDDIELF